MRTILQNPGYIPEDVEWDMMSEDEEIIGLEFDNPQVPDEQQEIRSLLNFSLEQPFLINKQIEIIRKRFMDKEVGVLSGVEGPMIKEDVKNQIKESMRIK